MDESNRGCKVSLVTRGCKVPLVTEGVRSHLSLEGGKCHLSLQGVRCHLSIEGGKCYMSLQGVRCHLSLEGGKCYMSLQGGRYHCLLGTWGSMDNVITWRELDGGRCHCTEGIHRNNQVEDTGYNRKVRWGKAGHMVAGGSNVYGMTGAFTSLFCCDNMGCRLLHSSLGHYNLRWHLPRMQILVLHPNHVHTVGWGHDMHHVRLSLPLRNKQVRHDTNV